MTTLVLAVSLLLQITPAQADQIALFVKQGGTLLIFMGEPVVAENYNQVLLPRQLLPGPR